MSRTILPIEYLETPHICVWRFILEGNVESKVTEEEVISKLDEKKSALVLTEFTDDIALLAVSDNVKDGIKKGKIFYFTKEDTQGRHEIYGYMSYHHMTLPEGWYSSSGVDSIISVLIEGGIEDSKRGAPFGEEYSKYIRENIPNEHKVQVNGKYYPLFNSAEIFLASVLSVKNDKELFEGIVLPRRLRFDGERRKHMYCSKCPFVEYCTIDYSGGDIERFKKRLAWINNYALAYDLKYGDGWYLIYRTAKRVLNYRNSDVLRAFKTEVKRLYGQDLHFINEEEEIMKKIKKEGKLNARELSALEKMMGDILKAGTHEMFLDNFTTAEMLGLVRKRFLKIESVRKIESEDENMNPNVVVLKPAEELLKHIWGD